MSKPNISVIIPFYNSEKSLKQCLKAVELRIEKLIRNA